MRLGGRMTFTKDGTLAIPWKLKTPEKHMRNTRLPNIAHSTDIASLENNPGSNSIITSY